MAAASSALRTSGNVSQACPQASSIVPAARPGYVRACAVRPAPSTATCAGCHSEWYCDQVHQKQDWKMHKEQCKRSRDNTGFGSEAILLGELTDEVLNRTDAETRARESQIACSLQHFDIDPFQAYVQTLIDMHGKSECFQKLIMDSLPAAVECAVEHFGLDAEILLPDGFTPGLIALHAFLGKNTNAAEAVFRTIIRNDRRDVSDFPTETEMMSLLHFTCNPRSAAKCQQKAVERACRVLLEEGAEKERVVSLGWGGSSVLVTPLAFAVLGGVLHATQLLLDGGANLRVQNCQKQAHLLCCT